MDKIEFCAQVGPWVCIKKQEVKEDTEKVEVSKMLASIMESMERKTWDFLKDDFDLENLDKVAYDITGAQYEEKKKTWSLKGKITEKQISEALAKLNSPATSRRLKSGVKEGKEIEKTYLTWKVLSLLGLRLGLDPKVAEKYLEKKGTL